MISKFQDFKIWWFQNKKLLWPYLPSSPPPPLIVSYFLRLIIICDAECLQRKKLYSFCERSKNGWEIINSDLKFRLRGSKTDYLEDAVGTGSENFLCYGLMRNAVREEFPCKFWKNKDGWFIFRRIGCHAYDGLIQKVAILKLWRKKIFCA